MVATIPSDADAAAAAFPWIEFEGRWGELQRAFFNGPTGPNLKGQWTELISWSEAGGSGATRADRRALRHGGDRLLLRRGREGLAGLVLLPARPGTGGALPAALVALVVFVTVRATWTPVRRSASGPAYLGQIVGVASMYVRHARVFLGIGPS